jgi:uncharacterized low-complexity protein
MAHSIKPIAAVLGAAFLASSFVPAASASSNPFSAQQLSGGYDLASYGKDAEGSCGDKSAEGSCGDKKAEGSCGDKHAEGSCGEKKLKALMAMIKTRKASVAKVSVAKVSVVQASSHA